MWRGSEGGREGGREEGTAGLTDRLLPGTSAELGSLIEET